MGKVALVTGGSRGIGKAISIELAKKDIKVAINFRSNEAEALKVLEEVKSFGTEAMIVKGDVSNSEDVKEMIEKIEEELGNIDILVNNAGINKDNLFLRTKEEDLKQTMEVNLYGAFNCAKAVARKMTKKRWGRIINVSSVVGLTGNIGQIAYSSSKAAIFGFTKTLAKELSSRNITVNAIAPGFIETEMTDQLTSDIKENIMSAIPLKRFGTSEEVASLINYLASEESGYITGQTIVIDGGMSI